MTRLTGRVAIVTGGGRGIGAATAKRLSSEGAVVAVVDRDLAEAEAVAGEIRQGGGEAWGLAVDVCVRAEVERMAQEALARH